jgi:hypothetical protein
MSFTITMLVVVALMIFPCGCQKAPVSEPSPTETAGTPGATDTVTITPDTPTPTPEVSETPAAGKTADLKPYSLSKGRRDPFVPFGATSGPQTVPEIKPETPGSTDLPQPDMVPGPQPDSEVTDVPVQVTGTFVSGGKDWAIIRSASGGGPSFMVSVGDKVGEYLVKSIDSSKVVLVWSGKEYIIKMQQFGPYSSPAKGSTTGDVPEEKSLPAPVRKKVPGGQPQMMPPPQDDASGSGGTGGGTGEGAKTE